MLKLQIALNKAQEGQLDASNGITGQTLQATSWNQRVIVQLYRLVIQRQIASLCGEIIIIQNE